MSELSTYSLAELRDVARRLELPGAESLAKSELLERLEPRTDDAQRLLSAAATPAFRQNPTSVVTGEPRDRGRPDEPVRVESGRGSTESMALVEPKIRIPDLPWAYEDDRLVLLVRDPRTLYVYWDFHPDTLARAREGLEDEKPLLRVWRLGGSEPVVVREFDFDLSSRSYFIYELEPNSDYRVEVLLRGRDGREKLVGRPSNVATLPANKPSAWIEDRFARLPPDAPLPGHALFASGTAASEAERRLHGRAYELSGGEAGPLGDEASSSQGIAQGFGGRSWSGTLVRK